jgi:hypothetical protein
MKPFGSFSQVVAGNSDLMGIVIGRRIICVILSIAVLITTALGQDYQVPNTNAPATTLTNQQLNTFISQRATQNVTTYFTTQFGGPLSGTWSGTVTDTGWNLTFSGSINGQTAAITESGTLTGTISQWIDSGTVGSTNVQASGTASLIKNNELKWNQRVGGADSISGNPLVFWLIALVVIIIIVVVAFCVADPDNCYFEDRAAEQGPPQGPSGRIFVSNLLNFKTGILFSSSVQQKSPYSTAIQEGLINYKTGAISYSSGTYAPAN